jgi:hypothetical protein
MDRPSNSRRVIWSCAEGIDFSCSGEWGIFQTDRCRKPLSPYEMGPKFVDLRNERFQSQQREAEREWTPEVAVGKGPN